MVILGHSMSLKVILSHSKSLFVCKSRTRLIGVGLVFFPIKGISPQMDIWTGIWRCMDESRWMSWSKVLAMSYWYWFIWFVYIFGLVHLEKSRDSKIRRLFDQIVWLRDQIAPTLRRKNSWQRNSWQRNQWRNCINGDVSMAMYLWQWNKWRPLYKL